MLKFEKKLATPKDAFYWEREDLIQKYDFEKFNPNTVKTIINYITFLSTSVFNGECLIGYSNSKINNDLTQIATINVTLYLDKEIFSDCILLARDNKNRLRIY